MKKSEAIYFGVGVFMVFGVLAMLFVSIQASNYRSLGDDSGYTLLARFHNIGGLKVRSPVTMAGVRIGRVSAIHFDDQSYEAVVSLRIQHQYQMIPDDTLAKILTAGLLGEQYIGLDPGGSERFFQDGETLGLTQSALVLEDLIGQFLIGKTQGMGL